MHIRLPYDPEVCGLPFSPVEVRLQATPGPASGLFISRGEP
jgi:hypothetical protein